MYSAKSILLSTPRLTWELCLDITEYTKIYPRGVSRATGLGRDKTNRGALSISRQAGADGAEKPCAMPEKGSVLPVSPVRPEHASHAVPYEPLDCDR